VLAVKIALALYMFYSVRFLRRRASADDTKASTPSWVRKALDAVSGPNAVLVLGVIVLLLADVLRMLVEQRLGG
jgi:hypothetical protein